MMPRPIKQEMPKRSINNNDAPAYFAGSSTSYYSVDEKATGSNSKFIGDGQNRDDDRIFNDIVCKDDENVGYGEQKRKSGSQDNLVVTINPVADKGTGTTGISSSDGKQTSKEDFNSQVEGQQQHNGRKNGESSSISEPRQNIAAIQQQQQQQQHMMNTQHSNSARTIPDAQQQQKQSLPDISSYQQIYHPAVAAAVAASAFFQKTNNNQGSTPNQSSNFPPAPSLPPNSVGGVPMEYTAGQPAPSNVQNAASATNQQIQNSSVGFQSQAQMHHKPSPFHMMYPKQFQVAHQPPIFSSHPTASPGYMLQQAQHAAGNFNSNPYSASTLNTPQQQQQTAGDNLPQNQKQASAFGATAQAQSQQRAPATSNSEQLSQMLQKAKTAEANAPPAQSHLAGTNYNQLNQMHGHAGAPGAKMFVTTGPQYPSPALKDASALPPPGANANLFNSPLISLNTQPGQTPPTPLNEVSAPATPQLHGTNYNLPNPSNVSQSAFPRASINFNSTSNFRGDVVASLQQQNLQDVRNTNTDPPSSTNIKSEDEESTKDKKNSSKRKNSTDGYNGGGGEEHKKQKAREKNRIHSRNSRLRKKDSISRMKDDNNFLQMFKVITEAMADMVSVHDLSDEARLVYANPSFVAKYVVPDTMQFPGLQLFHRQPNVRVPSSFLQLVHEEDAKTLIECLCLVRYDTTQAPILSVRMLASSAPPNQDGSRLYANFQARIQASPSVGTLIIVTRPLGSDNDCYRYIPKSNYTGTDVVIAPTGFVV